MLIKEIQGFRSLAVILVLLYHLDIPFFKFGYLGVDIFFVISGFIISKIIFEDLQKNIFSFKIFFYRRLKRLLPALIFVLLISSLISWLFLVPIELKYFGQSLFSTSIFLSNIYFFIINNDYFSPNTYSLLHLWSLSLELQFYFLYPIIILLIGASKKKLKLISVLIIFFSFAINLFYQTDEKLIFYLLPTRLWEFFAGCTLYYVTNEKNFNLKNYNYFFILIIFIILFLIYGKSNLFKYQILSVFIFILLFFLSYKKKNIFNLILVNKFSQKIAILSYPIFLVHFPIIYFFKYFGFYSVDIKSVLITLFLIFLTSLIVFNFEKKFYEIAKNKLLSKSNIIFITAILSFLIFLGLFFHITKGVSFRYQLNKNLKNEYMYKLYNKPSSKKILGMECYEFCKRSDENLSSLYLVGDSHAGDLEENLYQILKDKKINLYISYFDPRKKIFLDILDQISSVLDNNKIKHVFIVHHKRQNNEIFEKKLIKILQSRPDVMFYYFLPRVEFDQAPVKYKLLNKDLSKLIKKNRFYYLEEYFNKFDFDNLKIINQNNLLLNLSDKTCMKLDCFDGHDKHGYPLYRDHHHLSDYGAKIFLKNLFNQLSLD